MGFMDRLLGKTAKPATSRPGPAAAQAGGPSTRGPSSPQAIRKELVRVSVRDTLLHNGIPAAWVRADPLTTSAPGRETGVHVRLVVQHWDARLMQCTVALQEHVEKRILALDPAAENWLMGLSWQFDLEDVSLCPPLPHPGSWTAPAEAPGSGPRFAPQPQPQPQPAEAGADVISGPTRIGQASAPAGEDRRKALERMMSERDADFGRDEAGGFSKTQPMGFEKTRPMSGFDKLAPGVPEPAPANRRPPSVG